MHCPFFRVSVDMEPWICTMCIDIGPMLKAMNEGASGSNKTTLDENEKIVASRILMELQCDLSNSREFMRCPPKFTVSFYNQYYKHF